MGMYIPTNMYIYIKKYERTLLTVGSTRVPGSLLEGPHILVGFGDNALGRRPLRTAVSLRSVAYSLSSGLCI